MFHQPAWAAGSYSSGPLAAGRGRWGLSQHHIFSVQNCHPVHEYRIHAIFSFSLEWMLLLDDAQDRPFSVADRRGREEVYLADKQRSHRPSNKVSRSLEDREATQLTWKFLDELIKV